MKIKKYLVFIFLLVIISWFTYIMLKPVPYVFIVKWGSFGSGDGQFKSISDIAVDFESNVYIVDYKNHRIQKFNSSGKFMTKWSSFGSGDEQFVGPFNIAVDPKGYVYNMVIGPIGKMYVKDVAIDRIQKFDSSGKFITTWKKEDSIVGIDIDTSGYFYITIYSNNSTYVINKFTSRGDCLSKVEINIPYTVHPINNEFWEDLHKTLHNVIIDSSGYIYVVYRISSLYSPSTITPYSCIYKFDSSGKFITKWEPLLDKGINSFSSAIYKLNSGGRFIKSLKQQMPKGSNLINMAVDTKGNIFLTYNDDPCIYKYTSSGIFMTKFGSKGTGDGQFKQPSTLTVDSKGNVYVVDSGNYCIQKFAPKR